jgi:hypothetical protein
MMKRVMVRYRVKAERVAENEALVAAVFEQLAREQPQGLRYTSLKLEDGVSFVHLVESEPGSRPLTELEAFDAFRANLRDRCDEPPVRVDFTPVGVYEDDAGWSSTTTAAHAAA